jgi:hypothetical protein
MAHRRFEYYVGNMLKNILGNSLKSIFKNSANRRRVALAATLLLGAQWVQAQSSADEDADDKEKSFREAAVKLPAAPLPENLIPFYVSPTATQSFAIDSKSLSVGTDGVVRYTVVAQSSSGGKSVSYEGIRCASFEAKSYAFGHKDGSWAPSRRDLWQFIQPTITNRHQAALAQDYFCDGRTVAGKAAEILQKIRKN